MINLKTEKKHIAECSTRELLEYSQRLNKEKEKYPDMIFDKLFEAIEARRNDLNNNADVIPECDRRKAIDEFMEKKR